MLFANLPHEIIVIVVQAAMDATAVPSDVLCVCKLFHEVGTGYLFTHLRFTSLHRLHLFAFAKAPQQPIAPRCLTVDLTGKAQRGVLRHLCDALVKCQELTSVASAALHGGHDVRLRCLRLRMHTYSQDSEFAVNTLEQGLRAVSPDTFEWTGPDPDHHFSTAIVPAVAACLFKQLSSWRNIREVIVTNISFATDIHREGPLLPLMEDVPSLCYLYIGQATLLHAQTVAGMLYQGRMTHLGVVRLVDAYSESIWGPRLRKSDVEKAAMMLCRTEEQMAVIARIRRVVTCEKKTERIMGGDRVDGTHILE